ncbi:MAG: pyrimidine-nucleoside phosphorylase [Parasporobacterium sp.]|nr:pyrimidine-nucleoside phosphorylase [Parasporobacterium sp.]
MRMYNIIRKKRDGFDLTKEEIDFFVQGYTKGEIPDYQASAFAMAVYFKGMTETETANLTLSMSESGDMVDLSQFGDKTVDKHSTGGVGDKTSLVIAPVVSSLGAVMAKMSGRGLGHTGGTVDKLESIEGFRVELSSEEFRKQVEKIGVAVVGQSGNLAPADKKLYALRDVTATVDCIPLIASSIMSKKLAAGAKTIVLDVKCGSGAFMKTLEDARKLADEMEKIGKNCGRNVVAIITNMDIPLGNAVGNALEVKEVIDLLKGNGPEDLKEECVCLCSNIIALEEKISIDEAKKKVEEVLANGKAFEKFKEWIKAQGGNINMIENPELLPSTDYIYELKAEESGYLTAMDAEKIGTASVLLGAGREKKDDPIDYGAGIIIKKKPGDKVDKGDVLAVLHASDEKKFGDAAKTYVSAISISDKPKEKESLIFERL